MPRLDDPDAMMDGRKDPGRAQARSVTAKKAAETKRHRGSSLLSMPGSFPNDEESRADTPTITDNVETETLSFLPIPQTLPSLTLPAVGGQYEGPHAVLQLTGIAREWHKPAEQLLIPPAQPEMNDETGRSWNPLSPRGTPHVGPEAWSEQSRYSSISHRSEE